MAGPFADLTPAQRMQIREAQGARKAAEMRATASEPRSVLQSGPIRVHLATDSASTAHGMSDCPALKRHRLDVGEPVEVTVPPPGDKDTVTLRTVTGTRELRLCRKCWAR